MYIVNTIKVGTYYNSNKNVFTLRIFKIKDFFYLQLSIASHDGS